jgi:hypothetical protein
MCPYCSSNDCNHIIAIIDRESETLSRSPKEFEEMIVSKFEFKRRSGDIEDKGIYSDGLGDLWRSFLDGEYGDPIFVDSWNQCLSNFILELGYITLDGGLPRCIVEDNFNSFGVYTSTFVYTKNPKDLFERVNLYIEEQLQPIEPYVGVPEVIEDTFYCVQAIDLVKTAVALSEARREIKKRTKEEGFGKRIVDMVVDVIIRRVPLPELYSVKSCIQSHLISSEIKSGIFSSEKVFSEPDSNDISLIADSLIVSVIAYRAQLNDRYERDDIVTKMVIGLESLCAWSGYGYAPGGLNPEKNDLLTMCDMDNLPHYISTTAT